eukprot:3446150-Ditylum_brightwellii.AAC.1
MGDVIGVRNLVENTSIQQESKVVSGSTGAKGGMCSLESTCATAMSQFHSGLLAAVMPSAAAHDQRMGHTCIGVYCFVKMGTARL